MSKFLVFDFPESHSAVESQVMRPDAGAGDVIRS
jgi:hypothetical protein